ncbi:sigma-54 interaction domain-containing protein [Candidatus Uabimicrobium amorphum]|uniref:Transcriptional regulator n=1 Tax=Uabimicrobium amorphum TaxID=2596890 RepID=A0A5S9F6I8_UABAM|nr:sigma 54-interacting transcriptional regulator [Candidatus Uabimicrobium amorphum]BBM87936.1 transcriptional regulator [Candidatus Uabimicrobium amorphum]
MKSKLFRSAMDSACDGIVIADKEGNRLYFNPSFSKMFEWPLEQMTEKTKRNIFGDQQKANEMFSAVWSGKSWSGEMLMQSIKGKKFYALNNSNAIKDSKGNIIGIFGVYTDITEKKKAQSQLQKAYTDLQEMNKELETRVQERTKDLEQTIQKLEAEIARGKILSQENIYLNQQIRKELHFGFMVGTSAAFAKTLDQVKLVAHTNSTVLINGESGTGKELVARAIHESSDRKDRPLVKVNCASVPKELFESEFFGHVKGAFTGAFTDRVGRFQLANGGTLFLDEIGEMPLSLQSKFLRVLQEKQFERLGDPKTHNVDVRIIAATNKDLLCEVTKGNFRKDLYYRLSVFPIQIPPLRERKEDIVPLVKHFTDILAEDLKVKQPKISPAQMTKLQNYSWPGNIRELKNVVERALIISQNDALNFTLDKRDFSQFSHEDAKPQRPRDFHVDINNMTLQKYKLLEKEILLNALEKCQGKIYGSDGAAQYLQIPATTLTSKMRKFNISKKWQ